MDAVRADVRLSHLGGHPLRRQALIAAVTVAFTFVCEASAQATVVSDWNAAALAEVRLSRALRNGPPIVARALAIAHTCMYDAWAAYDDVAVGTTGLQRRPVEERS